MTMPGGSRGFADLERQSAELVEAMRLTARLLRALAPVATEMRALQDAMLTLQDASEMPPPPATARLAAKAPAPARLTAPPMRQAREFVPDAVPAPVSRRAEEPAASAPATAMPSPAQRDSLPSTAAEDDVPELTAHEVPPANGADQAEAGDLASEMEAAATEALLSAEREAPEAPTAEPASPARESSASPGRRRTVSVTVMRSEGPLDLVRVHGALDGMEGVTGLALASYTRGRANILLDTERDPADLDVREALIAAFPEGVAGEWTSDTEYVATIGSGSPVGS